MVGRPAPLIGGESETSNHDRHAIGEMVGSDQVLTGRLQASLWMVKAIFQLERNGALFSVNSEVRLKRS